MAEIIQFSGRKPSNSNVINGGQSEDTPQETSLLKSLSSIGELVTRTPEDVKDILNMASLNGIIVANPETLRKLIFDYMISKLREARLNLDSRGLLFSSQYLTELLTNLFVIGEGTGAREIIDNPYFSYWMNKDKPKLAGDASVYAYLFRDFSKRPIQKGDYLSFAHTGYFGWSGDRDFSDGVVTVLKNTGNMFNDGEFLRRGGLRIIN